MQSINCLLTPSALRKGHDEAVKKMDPFICDWFIIFETLKGTLSEKISELDKRGLFKIRLHH